MAIDIYLDDYKNKPNPTQHHKNKIILPSSLFVGHEGETFNIHGKGEVFILSDPSKVLTDESWFKNISINADRTVGLEFELPIVNSKVTAGSIQSVSASDSSLTATNGNIILSSSYHNTTLNNENGNVIIGSKEYTQYEVPISGNLTVNANNFTLEQKHIYTVGYTETTPIKDERYELPEGIALNTKEYPTIPNTVDSSKVKFNNFDGTPRGVSAGAPTELPKYVVNETYLEEARNIIRNFGTPETLSNEFIRNNSPTVSGKGKTSSATFNPS